MKRKMETLQWIEKYTGPLSTSQYQDVKVNVSCMIDLKWSWQRIAEYLVSYGRKLA